MSVKITVDDLAQEIRRVDGNHSLGAGALAEALFPFFSAHTAEKGEAEAAIELDGVAEQLAEESGAWVSCSGCHETSEGIATGPWSYTLQCNLGGGCRECGGIGAVWDNTDYSDIAAPPAPRDDLVAETTVSAVMDLIEERLAIIWARPGSREFFEGELRAALEGRADA